MVEFSDDEVGQLAWKLCGDNCACANANRPPSEYCCSTMKEIAIRALELGAKLPRDPQDEFAEWVYKEISLKVGFTPKPWPAKQSEWANAARSIAARVFADFVPREKE